MTLSAAEKKMIERLQKREETFRRWRWPLAIVHGGAVLASLLSLVVLAQLPDDSPNIKAVVLPYLLPPLYLFMTASCWWVGYVVVNWHGNATTQLLLRLIEEHHADAS